MSTVERDYRRACMRVWYHANLDKAREAGRRSGKKFYARNAAKFAAESLYFYHRRRQATPAWADKNAIVEFYAKRPEGYEVDHIVPLHGKNVCGLHVENNLQYLTQLQNKQKGNGFQS